jgi:hypothetical protein
MPTLDALLYQWISRANKRLDDFDLPIGFVEDSITLITRVLGKEYLEQLLISDSEPVHFLDDEANSLRKWLLSAMVDQHVIQVLELAAYFKAFENDPALPDKVQKLKHDKFHPIVFELAMATRVKRACRDGQEVSLNPENESSIGDFTLSVPSYRIPCECSRLGHSPQLTEPFALIESLSNRISDGTSRIQTPLCIKIRSSNALTGTAYNALLQLLRKCFADARKSKLPTRHGDASTTVTIEELTDASEKVPFQFVDGRVVDTLGTDWDSATRLCRVPVKDSNEVASRYEGGERFYEYESVRLFMKFGAPGGEPDPYKRLSTKLKKKLKQTKTSEEHFGKAVFIEVPFDLRAADEGRLKAAVREAALHSRSTLAIVLAHREGNPNFRHHYAQSVTCNATAAMIRPEVAQLFERLSKAELTNDPILGTPYPRSWTEAQARAREQSLRSHPD